MALKDTDDGKPDEPEADTSLDMSQAAVKKMIADARERGYITYDQLNTVLPPDQVSSDQIEDVMSMLNEMGINVVESEEESENLANKLEQEAEGDHPAPPLRPRRTRWRARRVCGIAGFNLHALSRQRINVGRLHPPAGDAAM